VAVSSSSIDFGYLRGEWFLPMGGASTPKFYRVLIP